MHKTTRDLLDAIAGYGVSNPYAQGFADRWKEAGYPDLDKPEGGGPGDNDCDNCKHGHEPWAGRNPHPNCAECMSAPMGCIPGWTPRQET